MSADQMVNDPALQQYAPKWKGKSANLSPLMQKLRHSAAGEVVNVCPYGCTDEDHDDNHLCHHVVGYTVSHKDPSKGENKKVMEPLGYDKRGNRAIQGAKRCAVPDGAHLERVTNLSRVYDRNAEKPAKANNFDELDRLDDEEVDDELPEEKPGKKGKKAKAEPVTV